MISSSDVSGERPVLSIDDLFLALGRRMRRILLFHRHQQGAATFDDLVDVLREYTAPRDEAGADDRRRLATALVEEHIPLLERHALVVYDRLHGTVELGTVPDDFGEWLDLAIQREMAWVRPRKMPPPIPQRPTPATPP